ncbi:hypothetical protein JCM1840_004954 [Sporobolomyces johnsonii]
MTPSSSSSSYSASLSPSTGFHPTLRLSLPASSSSPSSSCSLHALLALPPSFIADRYQLSQLHREGKLGLYDPARDGDGARTAESLVVHGEGDLEGPVWGRGGVAVLIKLREGEGEGERERERAGRANKGKERARDEEEHDEAIELEVPLHLRYQLPVEERWIRAETSDDGRPTRSDLSEVDLPWPWVFWACPKRDDDAALAPRTPLDDDDDDAARSCAPSSLPYSFPSLSASELYFLSPDPSLAFASSPSCPPPLPAPLSVTIPTGVAADLPVVEAVTVAAVWAGFLSLAWTAWRTWARLRREDKDRVATKTVKSQ